MLIPGAVMEDVAIGDDFLPEDDPERDRNEIQYRRDPPQNRQERIYVSFVYELFFYSNLGRMWA